ncbi:MAG: HEAT repeat domain-containing protein [Gallionella sp.]
MANTDPDALLFITPGCPHCATVLQDLSELVKQSLIGKLTVINVAAHPDFAEKHRVRTAPWLQLGPFTLTGAYSLADLRQWADWARGEKGTAHYIEHLLKHGGYQQAAAFVAADTSRLKPLLGIVANPGANIEVRLGVSALLEAQANTEALRKLLPQLAELTLNADHRVRADACHLLGLTGALAARDHIESCLKDTNEEVREIAAEALAQLNKQSS